MLLYCLASLLLFGCKVGKGDRPLTGGTYDEHGAATTAVHNPTNASSEDEELMDDEEEAEELSPDADAANILLPAALKDRPEQLLHRRGYTVSYNRDNRIPNWVAWTLTKEHTYGNHSRKGRSFIEDEDVPRPRATHYDYMRSGYDRGHMCPSGDNRWDNKAQNQSFLLTNVCPQNHNLNAGDWNDLEIQCRHWAKRYGEIHIVSGPILYNQRHKTIGRNRVVVPEAFFKVVLRLGEDPAAIAFIYRNKGGSRPQGDYVNTLNEVERITKIHFFAHLDPTIRAKIADHADLNDW